MFLVLLTYKVPLEVVDKHVQAHRAYLARHYADGTFLLSGPKVPRTGGFFLANADSQEALAELLTQDPFHAAGIADYEVIQIQPSMAAPALEFLLA